ncbi:MAG: MotA/TolQ/ExbB proton channel family protein [Phycisphaeraceae bacterium]|nr:MotA/TolQ/ExbB proton channel family protein [Phycisphaeraceae bacterium]
MSTMTAMSDALNTLARFFADGGAVMWPLLGMSIVSVTLSLERTWFWSRTHSSHTARLLRSVFRRTREGDLAGAADLAESDRSVYGPFAARLLADARANAEASAIEAHGIELIERSRPSIERFSVTLSTIVTAAPMLGILGTVTGIIESFQLLGQERGVTDPTLVAGGIAEALYTTVFGLVVALTTLFPYVMFRSQADRAFGRMESLIGVIAQVRSAGSKLHPGPKADA